MSIVARSGLLLAIAVAGALPVAAQEAVVLRLDPPVGQVTRSRMESKVWMLISPAVAADTSAEPTMKQVMYSTQTVAAADSGTRTITVVIDSSRMQMGGGLPPLGGGADWLRGMTMIKRVNADGDILSSTITPGPNAPPTIAPQLSSFGETVGQHGFPKRPLRVGETWTDSVTTAVRPGQTRTSTIVATLRLERIELRDGTQYATVSMKGSGGVQADSAHPTSISGDYEGEMVVDVAHRRLARLVMENRTRIESPTNPQTIYGRMTTTLIEP